MVMVSYHLRLSFILHLLNNELHTANCNISNNCRLFFPAMASYNPCKVNKLKNLTSLKKKEHAGDLLIFDTTYICSKLLQLHPNYAHCFQTG